jgi:hypothetical protein
MCVTQAATPIITGSVTIPSCTQIQQSPAFQKGPVEDKSTRITELATRLLGAVHEWEFVACMQTNTRGVLLLFSLSRSAHASRLTGSDSRPDWSIQALPWSLRDRGSCSFALRGL